MNQSTTSTRPFGWEDTATAEPLFRRAQQSVSPGGRTRPGTLPGMPLEMADPDGEDEVRPGKNRFGGPRNPWWRPKSMAGRVLLGVSLLTVLSGLTIGTLFLKNHLSRDARFRIEGASNIEATGLTEVSRKQMLPIFGEDIGRNIFFVPLSERRRELEEIPWVEHATVMRVLPDQIRVSLVERQPVAFVRQGNTIGLVDANGVLLSMPAATMARHHYSFPVVTGIDPADPIASRKARMAVYLRMVAELDANNQRFSEQVSEIDLTDPEDARVLMPEQGDDILAHFGDNKFVERFRSYKEHIGEWRKQYPRLASVDLRYDQQVVLQMKNAAMVEEGSGDKTAAAGVGTKPAAAKPVSLDTTSAKTTNAKPASPKTEGKAAQGATSLAKPKTLTAKQKAAKEEAAREKVLEAKAAKMRAARAKAAAAKQNMNPAATDAVADQQNDQPMAALPTTAKQNKKPAAMNLNGQKSGTAPHSTQSGTEGQ